MPKKEESEEGIHLIYSTTTNKTPAIGGPRWAGWLGPDLGQLVGLADELLDVAFSEVTVTRLVGREDDLRGLVLADGRGTPTPPPRAGRLQEIFGRVGVADSTVGHRWLKGLILARIPNRSAETSWNHLQRVRRQPHPGPCRLSWSAQRSGDEPRMREGAWARGMAPGSVRAAPLARGWRPAGRQQRVPVSFGIKNRRTPGRRRKKPPCIFA